MVVRGGARAEWQAVLVQTCHLASVCLPRQVWSPTCLAPQVQLSHHDFDGFFATPPPFRPAFGVVGGGGIFCAHLVFAQPAPSAPPPSLSTWKAIGASRWVNNFPLSPSSHPSSILWHAPPDPTSKVLSPKKWMSSYSAVRN